MKIPGPEQCRRDALARIWKAKHRDFKSRFSDGTRAVLVLRAGGTHLVPLDALTEAEITTMDPMARDLDKRSKGG